MLQDTTLLNLLNRLNRSVEQHVFEEALETPEEIRSGFTSI